jgi:O-antigen/teichoic acid export membrane protein
MSTSSTSGRSPDRWLRSGLFALLEKGAGLAFNLGTTVLLLRLLDKEGFATWGVFIILGYFVEMGRNGLIQNGLMRHLALYRDDRPACAAVSTAAFGLNLGFSLLSNALIWAGAGWIGRQYQVPQLAGFLPVYFLTNLAMSLYSHCYFVQQAHSEFRGIFWGAVCLRGLPFLLVVCCWLAGRPVDLTELALAGLAGALVGSAVLWFYARPFLLWGRTAIFEWAGRLLSFGKYVLGTNLSTMFYKNIDKLTLGHLLGPAAFAVYDAAGKVTQMVETPSFSVAAVVFPHSAERMAREGAKGVKNLYERSVAAILAIILPPLVLVLAFAEPIISLLAGASYAASADVLRWTAFFGLFLPFAVQFGTVLDSTGRPATNFAFTFFTALLNLGLSYRFVADFGLFGAAFATLLGYALSFVLMQIYLFKNFRINALNAFLYIPSVYGVLWNLLERRLTHSGNRATL